MLSTLRRAGLGLLLAAAAGAQTSTRGANARARTTSKQPSTPGAPRQATRRSALTPQHIPGPPPNMLHMPGNRVVISLLTMGVGDQIWELFGHTAILIRDDIDGRDTVMNWGEFDMSEPNFIPHFLEGLNLYQMGGEPYDSVIAEYVRRKRYVLEQELSLTTTQKDSLLAAIARNAMPDSIRYRYDYFIDNCATKPRDLLDRVLGGQLHAATNVPSGRSFRWHTLRLMRNDTPLVLGVDIGLGEPSDTTITKWGEMFLPEKLHEYVQQLSVHDSTGATRALVAKSRVLVPSGRDPEPDAPPPLAPWLFVLGLVVAAVVGGLGVLVTRESRPGTGARIGAGIALGLWTLVAGLLGVVLTLLWAITDHRYAHSNENLLVFNPLWLILCVLVVVSVATGRAWRWTRDVAVLLGTLAVVALAAHLVGVSHQVNLAVIGLALPPALALVWVAVRGAALEPAARATPA